MATRPVSFNQDIKALIPRSGLLPAFLLYSLQALSAQILDLVSSAGSGTGVLNTQLLQRLEIWIPDEQVQRRVVAAIDAAESYVSTLERLIAKKQQIKQGMMQQLLTGQTHLPEFAGSWATATLGSLGVFHRGRGIKRDDVRSGGTPCIRYGELYAEFDDYTAQARSFVSAGVAATAFPLQRDDLLFAGSGETREEIGKCVAYVGPTPAVAGGDVIVLRGDRFNSIYLGVLANSPEVRRQKARAGQGDAVVHIYSEALAAIEVSLPPREEQDAIAQVIIDANCEIAALGRRLDKARSIKQGMMQELLTGRTRMPAQEAAA
jgi:type I restriction enzyme S subunit